MRWRRPGRRSPWPASGSAWRIAHLTTSDMSLALLLATELAERVGEGHTVLGISAPGDYVQRVEALGVTHVPVPALTRSWDVRSDLAAFAALVRTLRELEPDVLHTHNPKTGVMGRIAGRLTGVPVVVNTCHGLWAGPGDRRAKRAAVLAIEAIAARFSDVELFQNATDRDALRWALRPGRHWVVGNGIDLDRFGPDPAGRARLRGEWGVGPHELVVGTVGRRVPQKGLTEFAAAATALGHRARFVWVGPADEATDAPEDLPGVQCVGEHTDMPAVYSAFDIFALPTYREGFSRASMEAAACGLPMVLTDIRGCREIGTDGEHLLLVPPRDAAGLIAGITRLLDDPQLRARLGAAARRRATSAFDQRAVAARSLRAYRRVTDH